MFCLNIELKVKKTSFD